MLVQILTEKDAQLNKGVFIVSQLKNNLAMDNTKTAEEIIKCTCHHYNGQYVYDINCPEHQPEKDTKDIEIDNLKSCMIAAAEEIMRVWSAHCDSEGYGPSNLMHRLEKGIPARYGYKSGDFESLKKRIEELEASIEKLNNEKMEYIFMLKFYQDKK